MQDYYDTTDSGKKKLNYGKLYGDMFSNNSTLASSEGHSGEGGMFNDNRAAYGLRDYIKQYEDYGDQMNKNIDAYNVDEQAYRDKFYKEYYDIYDDKGNFDLGKFFGGMFKSLDRAINGGGWDENQYLESLGYGNLNKDNKHLYDAEKGFQNAANILQEHENKKNKGQTMFSGLSNLWHTGNNVVDTIGNGIGQFIGYLPGKAYQGGKGFVDMEASILNDVSNGELGYNNYDWTGKDESKKDFGDAVADAIAVADAALTAYDLAKSAGSAASVLANTKNGLGSAIKTAAPELGKQYAMDLGENLMENYIDRNNYGEDVLDLGSYLGQIPFSATQSLAGELAGGLGGRIAGKTGLSKLLSRKSIASGVPMDQAISNTSSNIGNLAGKAATIGFIGSGLANNGVFEYIGSGLTGDKELNDNIKAYADYYGLTPEQMLYMLQYGKGEL